MSVPDSRTLREIIRARPMAIEVFEELSGYGFWAHLDDRLIDYCHEKRKDEAVVSGRIAGLPPAHPGDGLISKPLWYVVDYLTANHREFRAHDLPNMHRLFDLLRLEFAQEPTAIDGFVEEFTDFRRDLAWHMDEEEEFLFPKILRTEASLWHPELYPEIFKGSVNMLPKHHLHIPEEAFRAMLEKLTLKFRALITDLHQLPIVKQILEAMQAYDAKLKAHTHLEADVLFPRAAAMEASLVRRSS